MTLGPVTIRGRGRSWGSEEVEALGKGRAGSAGVCGFLGLSRFAESSACLFYTLYPRVLGKLGPGYYPEDSELQEEGVCVAQGLKRVSRRHLPVFPAFWGSDTGDEDGGNELQGRVAFAHSGVGDRL